MRNVHESQLGTPPGSDRNYSQILKVEKNWHWLHQQTQKCSRDFAVRWTFRANHLTGVPGIYLALRQHSKLWIHHEWEYLKTFPGKPSTPGLKLSLAWNSINLRDNKISTGSFPNNFIWFEKFWRRILIFHWPSHHTFNYASTIILPCFRTISLFSQLSFCCDKFEISQSFVLSHAAGKCSLTT